MTNSDVKLTGQVQIFIVALSLITGFLLWVYTSYIYQSASVTTTIVVWSMLLGGSTLMAMLVDSLRSRAFWLLAVAYIMVIGLSGLYTGYQLSPDPLVNWDDNLIFYYLWPQVIAWFILLFYARTWFQYRNLSFPYSDMFDASWDHFLVIGLTGLLVGLFWGLLGLWAGLFNMVGVDFFEKLFSNELFAFIATGLVIGVGVNVFRRQINAVEVLRRILRALMRWLLPLLVLMILIFLATLPFTGLTPLWETRYASLLLLWIVAVFLFLFNAVFQDSGEGGYPAWLASVIKFSMLAMPVFVALAGYAISLRVAQYGWTLDRLWASIVAAIAAGFAVSYSYALVRRGTRWFDNVVKTNRLMAAAIGVICILVCTPLLDLKQISTNSQIARLKNGEISQNRFDLTYLRFSLGRPGHEALQALKDSTLAKENSEFLAAIESTLKQKYRYGGMSVEDRIQTTEDVREFIGVQPAGTRVPEALWQLILADSKQDSRCFNSNIACYLFAVDVYGDDSNEFILLSNNRYSYDNRVYGQADGQWQNLGTASLSFGQVGPNELLIAIKSGDYQVEPSKWHTLTIGKRKFEFREY